MTYSVTCVRCGVAFKHTRANAAYCGEECRRERKNERDRASLAMNPERQARKLEYKRQWSDQNRERERERRRRYARRSASTPASHAHQCVHCGVVFQTTRGHQRFCCEDCRRAATAARAHAKYRARAVERPSPQCARCGEDFRRGRGKRFCGACGAAMQLMARVTRRRLERRSRAEQRREDSALVSFMVSHGLVDPPRGLTRHARRKWNRDVATAAVSVADCIVETKE